METGTVKFFAESKGYGFIKIDSSGEEVFVHVSGLIDRIREDDKVTFDVTEGRKGPNAINVKLLGAEAAAEVSEAPVDTVDEVAEDVAEEATEEAVAEEEATEEPVAEEEATEEPVAEEESPAEEDSEEKEEEKVKE